MPCQGGGLERRITIRDGRVAEGREHMRLAHAGALKSIF
jgi:hypothetical protein